MYLVMLQHIRLTLAPYFALIMNLYANDLGWKIADGVVILKEIT